MSNLLTKLKSRKFWAAIIGVITGISMVFGLDDNIINIVAGSITSIASIVVYIITEGRNDYIGIVTNIKRNIEPIKEGKQIITDIINDKESEK